MNLPPRSPYEKLGGMVHLPRLIDKVRLAASGQLEGYNYLTLGFDKQLLDFLCVDAKEFEAAVLAAPDDAQVLVWLKGHLGAGWPPANTMLEFNWKMIQRKPDTEEKQLAFEQQRAVLPGCRIKVETYFDLIDLEEGRLR